jgi:enoyl-CoA hydratase/carnithine racemase
MAGQRITIDIDTGTGIARVALARPEKMNALDDAMFEAINESSGGRSDYTTMISANVRT